MTVANGHDEPSAADVSAKINLAQSSRLAKVGSHDVTGGIELGANAIDDFPLACRRPGGCQLLRKMLQAGEVLQELLRVDSRQLADEILEVQ